MIRNRPAWSSQEAFLRDILPAPAKYATRYQLSGLVSARDSLPKREFPFKIPVANKNSLACSLDWVGRITLEPKRIVPDRTQILFLGSAVWST